MLSFEVKDPKNYIEPISSLLQHQSGLEFKTSDYLVAVIVERTGLEPVTPALSKQCSEPVSDERVEQVEFSR